MIGVLASIIVFSHIQTEPISVARREVPAIATSYKKAVSTAAFSIPELGINSALTYAPVENQDFQVPASTVGYNGTLYMGHTPGVFSSLSRAKAGQEVIVSGRHYTVASVGVYRVSDDRRGLEGLGYDMWGLMALSDGQIVLMTCTNGSSSYRTVVFAKGLL